MKLKIKIENYKFQIALYSDIKELFLIENLNFEINYVNSIKGINDSSATLLKDYCDFIGLKYY